MARKASNQKRMAITGGRSPSGISTAAELIAGNVDLLTEIFLRFPAKSLIRFKSVSKHWLSLISHPQFSTNHSSRNPSPSISGLYFYSDGRLDSVSLSGHQNLPSLSFLDGVEGKDSKPRILNSCNGLLLCDTGSPREPLYIVCNLTTQKYKVLPKPSGLSSRSAMRRGAYLAFDPSKSPHYKVVVGSHYPRSKREPWYFEIDTFNSESGNWKKIIPPDTCCGCGVFWSGAIYWLVSYKNVLMRFEVDAEEMTALPLRRRSLSKESMKYFGACCDGLIIIQTRSSSTLQLFTLELKSDTCWWILKYCMNLETIGSAFPEIENFFKFNVLCVVKGEKKEDYALVLAIPGNVITFNMERNTQGVLHDLVLGEQMNEGVNGYAYPFVETLCLV